MVNDGAQISVKKKDRTLDILLKLIRGETVSAKDLAERYGCSVKTVTRSFDEIEVFLADYNITEDKNYSIVNIEKNRSENGLYRLKNADSNYMSRAELLAISKILLDSRGLSEKEMEPIMKKLLNTAVVKEDQTFVEGLLKNEWYNYVEPSHKSELLEMLLEIAKAVKAQRVIRISYTKTNGDLVQRYLEPLGIIFSENYYYLASNLRDFDKEKYFQVKNDENPTMYRVDRIEELEILDERYTIAEAKRFKEGEYRNRIQFMFGGPLYHLKLAVKSFALEAVKDKLATARILPEHVEGYDYVIGAELFGEGILMWLMGQGAGVKLLAPDVLVEKLDDRIKSLAKVYGVNTVEETSK